MAANQPLKVFIDGMEYPNLKRGLETEGIPHTRRHRELIASILRDEMSVVYRGRNITSRESTIIINAGPITW
jgi:hypothetical protein